MIAETVARYDPSVFRVDTLGVAKQIILTDEVGLSSDQRWEREAPYLMRLIEENVPDLNKNSTVLDYGCGIGRMSKILIEQYGCKVIGVDISMSMLACAHQHVRSEKFVACHPEALKWMGISCDLALSVWVLQHTLKPETDIELICNSLRRNGSLFVVNEVERRVPTNMGWIDDHVNVQFLLSDTMDEVKSGRLNPEIVTEAVADRTFWGLWCK